MPIGSPGPFQEKNGKTKILIIEDEEDVAKMLLSALARRGYEVMAAGDGFEGLKMVKGFKPALVLLDINIPRIDGMDVLEHIKSSHETAGVNVVMCTAASGINDVADALGMGAEGYITKPIAIDRLLSKITEVLSAGDENISGGKDGHGNG